MKVPLSWLKEYVDIELAPNELAHRLTMAGVEAEGIEYIGADWHNILVCQIDGVKPHPEADRLQLATIDTGGQTVTVVCGAPNVAPGQKIAFAMIGATLVDAKTGQRTTLKAARIRGFESCGMVCSERELGLSEEHEGVLVLPEDAPVGIPLVDYYGDAIIELSPTPNRPDCLSVVGIAREVAAITGRTIREPATDYPEQGPPTETLTSVQILDPDLCLRYIAGIVTGVTIAASPGWMQQRLRKAGMRPINNIVDITNYVMLELGQPLHAFDYDRLQESRIVVRKTRASERMHFIDNQVHPLEPGMLAISDALHPVALAGVMGATNTEVQTHTTSILLEAAAFKNTSIRRTSKTLGLRSEASSRFEKGLSPDLPHFAARRAMKLIVQLAGGKASTGFIDNYPGKTTTHQIRVTEERAHRVLGMNIPVAKMTNVLTSLGFGVRADGDRAVAVTAPYWRTDIAVEEDLIEEVARITGYDAIPTTNLSGPLPPYQPQPMLRLKDVLRDLLVRYEMTEIVTYPLTSPTVRRMTHVEITEPLRVLHPISSEMEELRLTLRGGLLRSLGANERHETGTIKLFEIARIYFPRKADLPEEREYLGAVLAGPRRDTHWQTQPGTGENLNFFDTKGLLDTILGHFSLAATYEPTHDAFLHPGRVAKVTVAGSPIGIIGELHPKTLRDFDLSNRTTAYMELELDRLLPLLPSMVQRYIPFPRFPGVLRDLALVVDASVPAGRVHSILNDIPMIEYAELFDLYTGDQVEPGKKSLAYRLTYRSPERTLSNEEVEVIQARLLERLQREVGAALREQV